MTQFRGKNVPACSCRLLKCKWEMFNDILGLKKLYLKSGLDTSSFEEAQNGHIFALWTQIAAIFNK